MATIDRYKLKFEVDGVNNLQKANDAIKKTNDEANKSSDGIGKLTTAFSKFAGVIAAIGIGKFTKDLLELSDAMVDVSKSTGFSLQYVNNLAYALEASGGKYRDAGKLLEQFGEKMYQLKQGSQEVEVALNKLGISADDVRRSTDQELFETILERLTVMPASLDRTAVGVKLLGESFKTLDPGTALQTLQQGLGASAEATQKLADLNDLLERSFRQLQQAATNFIGRFLGDFKDVNVDVKKAEIAIAALAAALALAFSAKIALLILNVGRAIATFRSQVQAATIVQTAFNAISGPVGWARIAAGIVAAAGAYLGLNTIITTVKGQADDLNVTVEEQNSALEDLRATYASIIKNYEAGILKADTYAGSLENLTDRAKKYNLTLDDIIKAQAEKTKQDEESARAEEEKAAAWLSFSQQATQNAFTELDTLRKRNEAQEKYLKATAQNALLSSQEAQAAQADAARELQLQLDILNVDQRIAQERAKGDKAVQGVIDALQQQKKLLEDANIAAGQYALIQERVAIFHNQNNKAEEIANELMKIKGELASAGREEVFYQIALQRDGIRLTKEQLQLNNEIHDLEIAKTNQASAYGTQLQKILFNLVKVKKQLSLTVDGQEGIEYKIELLPEFAPAQDLVQKFINQLGKFDLILFDPANIPVEKQLMQSRVALIKTFYDELEAIVGPERAAEISHIIQMMSLDRARHTQLQQLRQKAYDDEIAKQQDIRRGMADAMEDLAKQFTPYQMAQKAVLDTWGTISDAVDTFVETGKFSFKEFARSIIADLMKMILKALIFKYIFGPMMSFFGMGSGTPGFSPKAQGGPVARGNPYIVGERGPELFVPSTPGKIIPNNQLAGMSAPAQQVYAPVSKTYNTYNINALDSKSVAQVFAENRRSMLGAVRMAEREVPSRA